MNLVRFQRPTPPLTRLRAPWAAAAALAAIYIIIPTGAEATEYPKRYELIRDSKGLRIVTVECDGITSQCVIRDNKGKRTGTVDQEPMEQQPEEPTLEEIIEETRNREPDGG